MKELEHKGDEREGQTQTEGGQMTERVTSRKPGTEIQSSIYSIYCIKAVCLYMYIDLSAALKHHNVETNLFQLEVHCLKVSLHSWKNRTDIKMFFAKHTRTFKNVTN